MSVIFSLCLFLQGKEMVEVAFKHAILHNPVFFKLALCEGFGDLMRHPAGVVEDLMLIEFSRCDQSCMVIGIWRPAWYSA